MAEEIKKVKKNVETIHQALFRIQRDLKAPKGQYNEFAKFNYRSCEDILEAVKPLLNGCSLTINDEVVMLGERFYVKATVRISIDRNEWAECTAYAREALAKKGMDEAQITGATSSYARKYALNGLFAIDDTKDADTKDNTKDGVDSKIKEQGKKTLPIEEALKMIEGQKDSKTLAQWRKKIGENEGYTKVEREKLIAHIDGQIKEL